MKSEKYPQVKVIVILQDVFLDYAYFKDNYRLIAAD